MPQTLRVGGILRPFGGPRLEKAPGQDRLFGKKVRDKDFILFNQELMALIRSGYPILKSIETIAGRVKNIHLKELLLKVEADIRSGKSLSEAFLPYEDRFSKVYTASLMAGEKSGNLAGTIGRLHPVRQDHLPDEVQDPLGPDLSDAPHRLLLHPGGRPDQFHPAPLRDVLSGFQAEMPAITTALISFAMAVRRNLLLILLASGRAVPGLLCASGKTKKPRSPSTGSSSGFPSAGPSGGNRAFRSSAGRWACFSRRASRFSRPSASPARPCRTSSSSGA